MLIAHKETRHRIYC